MISLVRLVYNLCFPVVLIILLPGFLIRMFRRGKYRHKFWQRFGLYSQGVRQRIGDGRVWVHAVSVGEVMIALKLVRAMRERDPGMRVVLSTTTSTGFKLAARAKSPWLEPIYNPLDFFFTARAAVRAIRPRQLILVEAEAWPNILSEVRAAGASIVMVNTRLSPRSERRYRLARFFVAPVFNLIDRFCLQEPGDVERWLALGVERSRLVVTGSIKFDEEAAGLRAGRDFRPVLRSLGVPEGASVVLGGSTFPGEEEVLARVYQRLLPRHAGLLLILVPRHFERGGDVERMLGGLGLRVVRRTQGVAGEAPDVLLVDTTGELRDWFACATVAFMGKSLTAKGGQNPAEPVAAGVPVVFGPNMQNFASLARELLTGGGAVEVRDETGLFEVVDRLLRSPVERAAMAEKAARCLNAHRGATERTCDVVREYLRLTG